MWNDPLAVGVTLQIHSTNLSLEKCLRVKTVKSDIVFFFRSKVRHCFFSLVFYTAVLLIKQEKLYRVICFNARLPQT